MREQVVKAALALGLLIVAAALLNGVYSGLKGARKAERSDELVLLAERPEDPQRAIVIVRATRLDATGLTVELELRNNSGAVLQGQVWGQARLGAKDVLESRERLSFKARVKTFKRLTFPLPPSGALDAKDLEIFVLDDATGVATRYGADAPKPAA